GAFFQRLTGTRLQFVPYRSTAMTDLVSGHIDMMIDQASNALAQIRSGNIKAYAVGQGLPRDYVRAHMWLNLSMTDGATTEWFEKTVGGLRDTVAQRMSSEQIAEAEKLARKWKPTKQ